MNARFLTGHSKISIAKAAFVFSLALILSVSWLMVPSNGSSSIFGTDTALAKSTPKMNKKKANLVYGKTLKLKVSGTSGKSVKWSTSNKKVAKIVSKGKAKATIKAMGAGKATIKAKVNGKTLKCKIKVVGKLSTQNVSVMSFQNASVKLKGAKVKSWSSSDPSIVSVNKSGAITTHGFPGKEVLTCTDTVGNKYKCNVTVNLPAIDCDMLSTVDIYAGETYFLKKFHLYNRSNYTIKLENSFMLYYPTGEVDPYEELILVEDEDTLAELEPGNALVIPPGEGVFFYGFEGEDYYDIYSDGTFAFFMKVGSTECQVLFETGGDLLNCKPYNY